MNCFSLYSLPSIENLTNKCFEPLNLIPITVFLRWSNFLPLSLFYLLSVIIPKRFNIAVMLFMACLMSYMMRVNLSINIIAMVKSTDANSTEELPDVSIWFLQRLLLIKHHIYFISVCVCDFPTFIWFCVIESEKDYENKTF